MPAETTFSERWATRAAWVEKQAIAGKGLSIASWNRLGSSRMGRALQMGLAESVGFQYQSMFGIEQKSLGFLGMGDAVQDGKFGFKRAWKGFRGGPGRPIGGLGLLNIAFTGYQTYQGYKEGGILGAASGFGEAALYTAAPRMIGAIFGSALTGIGLAAAAGGLAYKAVGDAAIAHNKRLRKIEFGGGNILEAISSAGSATMRQRSLAALQNTHINGRMALGNEAIISHTYYR